MQEVQLFILGDEIYGEVDFVHAPSKTFADSNASFTPDLVGKEITNTTDDTTSTIVTYVNSTTLTIADDIFIATDTYRIGTVSQRLELFEDETISINDTIQNVRDISKVFTTFSKQFNIPASKTTNKIFKHYYNADIVDGFDARFKVDALIKLNGVDWKKGKLRLNSVSLKDNVAYSYKVVFFGQTVSLSDLLGDDELSSLGSELSGFNHTISSVNTLQGFQDGWDLVGGVLTPKIQADTDVGDLIYPFISPDTNYYFNVADPAIDGNNLHVVTPGVYATDQALQWKDLKPALKVRYIIEAIETKYGFTFSDDFFTSSNNVYEELFLWLHREKGDISGQVSTSSYEIKLEDWDLTAPDTEFRSNGNTELDSYYSIYQFDLTINVTGAGLYDVELIDDVDGTIYDSRKALTGNISWDFLAYGKTIPNNYTPKVVVSTQGGITDFNISCELGRVIGGVDTYSSYTFNGGANVSVSSGIDIGRNMPKMKTIDFLTSIWKMFNLTAYVEDDVMVVKTLDDYYAVGSTFDITKYIDVSKSSVDRSKIFSTIDFTYKEPKTVFTIKSNEFTGEDFGDLTFKSSNDSTFDGGKYEVVAGFEKTIYERIIDASSDVITSFMWGYFTDKDLNPIVGKPLLFYGDKRSTSQLGYFDDGTQYWSFARYMRPSNVIEDATQTLNFGAELDEWTLTTNNNSLFANYYDEYISNVFDIKTRIYKFEAYLPLSVILNYKLNDVFVVSGKQYHINNISINLQTGKSKLELITI